MRLPRKALNGGWEERTLKGNANSVSSVSFSADAKHAVSGCRDGTLKLWEVATGRCIRTIESHTAGVKSVTLSADGNYALSGSSDNTLKLWEVATGQCLRTFEGHMEEANSVSLSLDGKYALSGSSDDTLKLWDVSTGRCLRTLEGHWGVPKMTLVSLSADGKYALSGGSDDPFSPWSSKLKLWDVATGRCLRSFKDHKESVCSVSLSVDGGYALSGSLDKTVKLWDVSTGNCLRTFEGHTDWVESVALSMDGNYVLSGSRDKTVKLWEVATGRCLRTFEGHTDFVNSVCFSADGKYALSGSRDKTLKLWILDWELDDRQDADWDEGAKEHLHTFLMQHTPYSYTLQADREPSEEEITLALTRRGKPTWSEGDFQQLLHTLGCVGYGWLRPEGVRRELEKMAKELAAGSLGTNQSDVDQTTPEHVRSLPIDESQHQPSEDNLQVQFPLAQARFRQSIAKDATTAEPVTSKRPWWKHIWKS